MVWPLLDVIDASCAEDWCAHAGDPSRPLRAGEGNCGRAAATPSPGGWPACSRPAQQRPQLLVDWERDIAGDIDPTSTGSPLCGGTARQHGRRPPHIRHAKTRGCRITDRPAAAAVAVRAHQLPSTEVELLHALATHHDLHLWLPHPSDDLWQKLAGERPHPRRDDTSHRSVSHPLLATLGRDLRELQRSLPAEPHTDEYLGGREHPDALLGWLQSDIAANAVRPGGRTLRPDDRSVQVHSCHGPRARSTCCGKCCSACSPTTPRWSRATSW